MIRIICIGNRYVESDAAGPLVHDQLKKRELPDGVSLVNGGLSGLNLLGLVEECTRVVFVDAVEGFGKPGEVTLIEDPAEVADRPDRHDHGTGLAYLLGMIDQLVDGPAPEILVVGVEPPFTDSTLWRAAEMSVVAATRDKKPPAPVWQEARGRTDLIA